LSLLSHTGDLSDLQDLMRERYVHVVHREGAQRLCRHVEFNGLTPLLEMCRVPSRLPSGLPTYSCLVRFEFRLATPYVSRDERVFYFGENPVQRDRTLGLPIISGTSWKGNLRQGALQVCQMLPADTNRDQIIKLFGNERGEGTDFNRGRL